jgi:hypothetical protein
MLQQQYRKAVEQHRAAKSPVEAARWATVMACCISELQHPDLAELSVLPT